MSSGYCLDIRSGATGVAAASSLPLRPERVTTTFIDIVSRPVTDPHQRPNARLRVASPGLFSLPGTRILAGRPFSPADRHDAQAVAIVNEAFVRRFLADADPLHETIRVPGFRMRRTDHGVTFDEVAIVGIVADVRHAALHLPAEQTVYLAHEQQPLRRPSLIVSAPPGRLDALRREVALVLRAADPEASVAFDSMGQVVASSLSRDRAGMVLMALFGFAALILVTLGVFGVVGYLVASERGKSRSGSRSGRAHRKSSGTWSDTPRGWCRWERRSGLVSRGGSDARPRFTCMT